MADTDPLTGLVNHRRFHELLGEALAAAGRGGPPVSVAMMDLDRFEAVNDAWGHVVGDQVLRETADRLRRSARSDDVLARVGGEEFAWLLRGADRRGAARAVERGREAVSALPVGPVARVTLSAGLREAREGMTAREVVGSADAALYLAKAAGRDALREAAALG